MGFTVITLDKDVFIEKPFVEVVKRMGWKLTFNDKNWLISIPCEDEALFDFVFGV